MSFFPLWNLKGTQSVKTPAVWVAHLEEDGTDKEEGAKSDDSNGIEGMTEEFIVCLARAVKEAQQDEKCCYHCSSTEHFIHECLLVKASSNSHPFKLKGGDGTGEGSSDPSSQDGQAKGAPGGDTQGIGHHIQTPFLNPDPFHQWHGIKNVAQVRINGESCMALLDNGTQINTIMPSSVESCSFEVGPLSDLVGECVTCVGLGNALTWPMGYVIIWVQVDGVQGYDEDQIAMVIPDLSNFVARVPIILGTPTISHIVNMIKEKDIDALVMPWVNAWVAYLLAVWWATATVESDKITVGESYLSEYDEVVTAKDTKTIDAFSSYVIHARTGMAHTGEGINMMTQTLCTEDGSLSQGLAVQNAYTELHDGSRNVAMGVRNSTAYPQTLRKKSPVARAVTVTWVPEHHTQTSIMEVVDGAQGLPMPKLTVEQRQRKLFEELDLSGLESWPPKLADSAWCLLAEYHNVFSLEPSEFGCTHLTEHLIKVTYNTPFKEWFWQISPPLVEEVHTHFWEMLDSGAICPSQSVWCNAVVLVQKKDRGLHFCIDFCHLNAHTKKDWRRGQQEVRVDVAFRRCLEGFWSIETGMHDSSHFGFCWLH